MPTICKKDTCRNPAVYGFCFGKPLFCSDHREPDSKNTRSLAPGLRDKSAVKECIKCSGKNVLPRFKGYCSHCYVKLFPLDPLSLQTVYKSKDDVIQKYIDSQFDGFIHGPGVSQIQINGFMLKVVFTQLRIENAQSASSSPLITAPDEGVSQGSSGTYVPAFVNEPNVSAEDEKTIVIKFNPNKYENGKNPMLYTRLPDLEKEISKQFERIMNG